MEWAAFWAKEVLAEDGPANNSGQVFSKYNSCFIVERLIRD